MTVPTFLVNGIARGDHVIYDNIGHVAAYGGLSAVRHLP